VIELALRRIEELSTSKIKLEDRLGETIGAVLDLARICEAVRHSSGLEKHQWERIEKARAIAAKADEALKSSRAA